jgi:hypothetical protein
MAWYDSVGKMAKSVVDFSGIPGLIHDISTAGSNDDPWYVDGVNLVKNTVKVGTTPVRGAVKGLLALGQESYELGGKVRREGVDVLLSNPFMYNKYKTEGESYSDYTTRVDREKENISLGQATLGAISPGKNAGDNSGWFADWTDNNFRFLSSGFDLFNAEDREIAFNDQYTGKFISGVQDVVASAIIDPLTFTGFLGKGAVIAAKAPMLENINGRTARAVFGKFAMTNDRMDGLLTKALDGKGDAVADIKFLAESDAKTQYAYWKKKKVTNPDAMAYIFGKAKTDEEVVDTFRAVMLKDTTALAKRAEADPDVALALDSLQDVPHPMRQALEGKLDGDVIISEPYNSALGKHVQSLAADDFRYRAALETVSTGGQLKYGFSRGPWEGKLAAKSSKQARETFAEADSAIFQASSLHPIIKVVNHFTKELPSGAFNVNDGDSYVEFNAFLREANSLSRGNFGSKAAAYADEYLASVTPGERLNTIKRAERDAMETLFPNYDKQQLDTLYAVFDARRASAIKKHNDQGFVSYMENGQVIAAQAPVLQRESANVVVIADLRKLKHGIDAHEMTLPGLLDGIQVEDIAMRTERGLAVLNTINDIFKTSVLMRLGYTVRNLTEAQLSMLAKGFALPAMVAAGGKDGVARFFNNRKVGFNRLIDQVNVMSGKVDDLKTLQYEFATGIDQLRAVDMSRQQLAKAVATRIGEIERDRFKLRLTGDTGPLNVEDELRVLRGALEDLESVTLYHGSPDDVFALDKTRSLALSASPTIANRYASGGIIKSVEQYIETPSGRPGRLGQKPESISKEIGTPAVTERMPAIEMNALDQYVQGDLNGRVSVQNILRGNPTGELAKSFAQNFPIEDLKRAIQRSVIKENTVVFRGTSNQDILNAKVGDVITEKGFTSTSKEYRGAEKFAGKLADSQGNFKDTIVRIQLPKGTRGLDVNATYGDFKDVSVPGTTVGKFGDNSFVAEQEVLLPPGTKFEVVGIVEGQPKTKDFPAIQPTYTLRAIVEEPKLPTPKRQDVLNEAMLRLQSDMIDAVNSGASVEVKRGNRWQKVKSIDYETLVLTSESDDLETLLFKDWSVRPVFRVNAVKGSVTPVRAYGKPLYMTQWGDIPVEIKDAAFGGKQKAYRAWVTGKGWKDANDPATKVMQDNGYGRLVVADDSRAGGVSQIVLPGTVGKEGRENSVKSYLAKLDEEKLAEVVEDFPAMEQKFATAKERRMARHQAVKRQRVQRRDNAVNPYYTAENVHAMINNGVEDAAENLSRIYAMQHAHLDDMADRIGARITAAESNAIKSRTGYGTMSVDANGHAYDLPNAFEGASWFLGRTSAEQTWNAMVSSQEMAFTTGIGSRTVSSVKPNDPRYFEAWSNILNMHFRDPESGIMDPLVRQILDGASDTDLLKWFKTFDGSKYANDTYTRVGEGIGFTKLRAGELDEHLAEKIATTRNAVKVYIPDEDTALFLSTATPEGRPMTGGEVQDYLMNRFGKNPEELPEINGLLVTSSKEYKDQERLIDTFNRRVMRFLGSLPEDVFARHPLTQSVYSRRLRLNIDQMSAAKGSDRLTAEELSRAVRGAREEARQEVERTLFTIVRRTGASSSTVMSLMFPFYKAYENTIKRWGGIVSENPSVLTNISRTIAQVVNGQLVVDQDGNRITDTTQIGAGGNLVIQVPEGFINSLPASWKPVVENAFKNINIPLQSLDVITQGQPGNPGAGPYLVAPAYLILKSRPELEEAFEPLFPAGQPQKVTDLFTPAAVRRLTTMWTQDELYVRTFNQMLRYETYNFNAGKRDEPTLKEITDKTNKFFMLRALTSISAPFAIAPEMDFYQRAFRQFQEQYGPGEAEAKFLEMYPDYFEATVSLSKTPGGLEANVQTVRNLKKYSNLMASAEASGNPELIGFLANDFDGQYTFSQAAYQWQYRKGAYPGSKNTYRQNRNPAELVRDANVKRGWTEFGRIMDGIDAFKIQNGISSDRDPRLANHLEAKRLWVQATADVNFDWYSEYISPDRGKYERRARVLETALQDKAWMTANGERPVVKSLAVYLDIRKKIAAVLDQRDRLGGSGSLEAKSNADVADVFSAIKTQLVAESPEFGEFFNRYFLNDSVVV